MKFAARVGGGGSGVGRQLFLSFYFVSMRSSEERERTARVLFLVNDGEERRKKNRAEVQSMKCSVFSLSVLELSTSYAQ